MLRVLGAILTALTVTGSAGFSSAQGWVLDGATSKLAFGSIKKNKIGEVHRFERISGSVSDTGAVLVEIDLSSVQTDIDVRNERMRAFVFGGQTTGTLKGQIDMAGLKSLPVGGSGVVDSTITLSLLGQDIPIAADLFVLRITDTRVLVSTDNMVFVSSEDLGVDDGITKLMGLAQLSGITRTAPVTARFIFNADANAATTAPASATVQAAASQATGDAAKGKRVFNKCKACHKLEAGKNGVGPSLAGIIGRPSGQVEGYKYSDAMEQANLVWTHELLEQYLRKPKDLIPGTKMLFAGLRKDSEIADLLAYLEQETQ